MATRRKKKRARPRRSIPSKRFQKLNRMRKARIKRLDTVFPMLARIKTELVQEYNRLSAGSLTPSLLKPKIYKVKG